MDYLDKGEVLTNTDLDRFVNNIWEKQPFCVIVLDLWVQLMKNGGKNKSIAFIILFSIWTRPLNANLSNKCNQVTLVTESAVNRLMLFKRQL